MAGLYFEVYEEANVTKKDPFIGVLVHGGGGTIWNKSSKPYKWLSDLKLCSIIYSIEIPCHGHNIPKDEKIPHGTTVEHLIQFDNTINKLDIKNKKLLIVMFSLGGSFVFKLLVNKISSIIDYKNSIIISIGSVPLTLNNISTKKAIYNNNTWNKFWDPKIQKIIKFDEKWKLLHGNNWYKMSLSVKQWFKNDKNNPLIFNENEINKLFNSNNKNIYFILGKYENVYCKDYLECIVNKDYLTSNVYIISCGHFTYFNKQGWIHTVNALNCIIQNELYPIKNKVGIILSKKVNKL